MQQKEDPAKKPDVNKLWIFIRRNGFSMLMGAFIVLMLVSPDAKAWVLRQLMTTGIFNAKIDEKNASVTDRRVIDFEFTDDQGNVHHTASLRGKVVFINFWASWCPPCRAEFPSIQALYSRFKDNPGIFFLMINEDNDLAAAKTYLEKENLSVPFFKARHPVPGEIYTGTLPTTVVLDKNGQARFRHEGFASYQSEKFIKQIEELMLE